MDYVVPNKITKKRTCNGCRAWHYTLSETYCELGYSCSDMVPTEPCPKPKSNLSLQGELSIRGLNNGPTKMLIWSKNPPMTAGWYWCRFGNINISRCVEVYGVGDVLMFGSKRDDFNPQIPVTREGFEWAGPIPMPIDPFVHVNKS